MALVDLVLLTPKYIAETSSETCDLGTAAWHCSEHGEEATEL